MSPAELSPPRIAREFRRLLDGGAVLKPAGRARRNPRELLARGYTPKYKIDLFETAFYLTNARQNPDIRFFVAYVVQSHPSTGKTQIFPRIFYKDVSLIWRSPSHFISTDDDYWIGKGEVQTVIENGEEVLYSDESTTDLPYEMQTALETSLRRTGRVRRDNAALELVLRQAPADRIEPYRDFTAPRKRAAADPRNLINGGKSVAYLTKPDDPGSLRFARGFEPDFDEGIIETSESMSSLYGGRLRRFRILSTNRRIQYLFFAGPTHVWIIPPQATTIELSSYGVRTVDVAADDSVFMPGYEYHFLDDAEDPPVLFSQIPEGYVGEPSEHDPNRADASAWIEELPVVRQFRKRVLARASGRPGRAAGSASRLRVTG